MRALLVLTILLMVSAVVQADKVVRDQYGKLVEIWRQRGNSPEMGKGMDSRLHGNDKGETARSWEFGDGSWGKKWIPVFTGMTYGEGMTGQRMDIN